MDTRDDDPTPAGTPDGPYRTLPPSPRLDDALAAVDPGPPPDPFAGRNVDQHAALRDH
ncbi:hypothetical protein [Nocardioides perillae]|uniref:Uncharacterized protein n=1 Tax=Nocardioides perillae TaxID=1119534 RepID=A0A7Y9RU68_9ACTN|nr:hypothetical protein [Nocardioides perillae]NYG55414.1 hypothetical protein [Nocardioides perillae]